MTNRGGARGKRSTHNDSGLATDSLRNVTFVGMVVVFTAMKPTVMVTKTSFEGEPYELRCALEIERSVDDKLPDIFKTPVNSQYVTRVRVL